MDEIIHSRRPPSDTFPLSRFANVRGFVPFGQRFVFCSQKCGDYAPPLAFGPCHPRRRVGTSALGLVALGLDLHRRRRGGLALSEASTGASGECQKTIPGLRWSLRNITPSPLIEPDRRVSRNHPVRRAGAPEQPVTGVAPAEDEPIVALGADRRSPAYHGLAPSTRGLPMNS